MSNFMKVSLESAPRIELHEKLGITDAEISINTIEQEKAYLLFILINKMKKFIML